MTILVGYVPGEGGAGGIQLGAMLAESLDTDLVIATVAPTPWTTPSPARIDAEFVDWTDQFIDQAFSEVTAHMNVYPATLTWRFDRLDHRAASAALAAHAKEIGAAAVVL
ncbi:MAG: universal stress protein, partial [Gordonia amarae]